MLTFFLLTVNAQDFEPLYFCAWDYTGEQSNKIELTTTDGDMYSATGCTFIDGSTTLNSIQIGNAEWTTYYGPAGAEVKVGTILTFEENGAGGWIWGWTLSPTMYIYFQKSTGKCVISVDSSNPLVSGEVEHEDLYVYAWDSSKSASIYVPLNTKDGVNYYATGCTLFPSEAPDGFSVIKVVNKSETKQYAPTDWLTLSLDEPVTFVENGACGGWIGWTPSATDYFRFNISTGKFAITSANNIVENTTATQIDELSINEYATIDGTEVAYSIILTDGIDYINSVETIMALNASYDRVLDELQTSYWQAVCLPFNVSDWSEDFEVLRFSNTQDDEGYVTFEYLADGEMMEARYPYIVKAKDGSKTSWKFSASDVAVYSSLPYSFGYPDRLLLKGTFTNVTLANDANNTYYGLKNGEFRDPGTGAKVMKPFRAYLYIPLQQASSALKIKINETPSGIQSVENRTMKDGVFYRLNGQQEEKPTSGIYIYNGQKVYIR